MAGTRVQKDVGGVQSAHSDQTNSIPEDEEGRSALQAGAVDYVFYLLCDLLFVSMKGRKGETFALIFPKEFTFLQADVMHFVG